MMQRRTLLKLGWGSAVVFALGGGAAALLQPGLEHGALSPRSRLVMARIATALIADAWPQGAAPDAQTMDGLLDRINEKISGTQDAVQAELSQLLTLLDTAAGRRGLVGISSTWEAVGTSELADALQAMRTSGVSLRQQAYLGLHDLIYAAHFSARTAWPVLGYPGPVAI